VVADNGHTYLGVNVENASYGLTVCAERVAVFSAVAAGARRIERIALTTERPPIETSEAMPCGACRQVLAEFMQPDAVVVVDRVGSFALSALLPLAFVLPS
jgi:cytidine deaminase